MNETIPVGTCPLQSQLPVSQTPTRLENASNHSCTENEQSRVLPCTSSQPSDESSPPAYEHVLLHDNNTSRQSSTTEPIFRPLPSIHQDVIIALNNATDRTTTDVNNINGHTVFTRIPATINPPPNPPSETRISIPPQIQQDHQISDQTAQQHAITLSPQPTNTISLSHTPSNLRRYYVCRAMLFDCCSTRSSSASGAAANGSAKAAMRYGTAVLLLGAACVIFGITMTLILHDGWLMKPLIVCGLALKLSGIMIMLQAKKKFSGNTLNSRIETVGQLSRNCNPITKTNQRNFLPATCLPDYTEQQNQPPPPVYKEHDLNSTVNYI